MKEFLLKLAGRTAEIFLQLLDEHPGKVLGAVIGFILGLIVVVLGFWRTLVIALFVAVGTYLGSRQDEHKDFGQLLEMLFGERK